jgi:hypothetical protein
MTSYYVCELLEISAHLIANRAYRVRIGDFCSAAIRRRLGASSLSSVASKLAARPRLPHHRNGEVIKLTKADLRHSNAG